MYSKEKQKPKKTHKNLPSFSSSLLDEICRSIDETPESPYREKPTTGFRERRSSSVRDEEKSRSSRACLVEKWMESKEKAKKLEKNRDINDLQLFSSNSSSSDSSGALSSSDNEFFFSSSKLSNSIKRPKSVRTSVSPLPNTAYLSPEDSNKSEEKSKSKSRALKIYANLRKLKQPISPGMKLTSLINSFFSRKKSKESKVHQEQTCSSFSMPNNSSKNVRFDPVDQESKPCCKQSIYVDRYGRPPLPPKVEDQRKFQVSKNRNEDEDDACSDSSSDLFELDHLSLFGRSDRFCEELPVYKTTNFGKNRGLIR